MYIAAIPNIREREDHHITLTYNGKGENKTDYMNAVIALSKTALWWHMNGNGHIQANFGNTELFQNDPWAWYAKVSAPKLHRFRERLVGELLAQNVKVVTNFEFTPHLTLGYGENNPNISNPYVGLNDMISSFVVIPSKGSVLRNTEIQI